MAVWYLDNDDEITDAVARLRKTDDEVVVFVVPPGSRIATGRLNFKLLEREARSRSLTLAVASPDEQVRATAEAAGVLARQTPDAAAAALAAGEVPAAAPPPTTPSADAIATTAGAGAAVDAGPLTWRSRRLRGAVVVILALAVVGGFLLTQVTPSAEITLRPRLTAVGPLSSTIIASADTAEADPASGRIPALPIAIPLSVGEEFGASGSVETTATGEVVFSAVGQVFDQEIAAGTRVRTPAGIEFQTTRTVTLPRGQDGSASDVTAPVEAITAGVDGNVEAGAISVVPSLEGQGIGVTNPQPSTGGSTSPASRVTAADYDRAVVELRNRLAGALDAYLRDPADTPTGLTIFPESASLGSLTLDPPAEAVVGRDAGTFRLSASVDAQVLAVDEATVDETVRAQLLVAVPAELAIVPGSVRVEHGEGIVDGERITFSSTASADALPRFEPSALVARIAGLPVSDAQAILDELGTATVNVWPGFLGDLPSDRDHITLDIVDASTTE